MLSLVGESIRLITERALVRVQEHPPMHLVYVPQIDLGASAFYSCNTVAV